MLYASPSAPTPIGAITGMKSRESSRLISSGIDSLDLADEPDVDELSRRRVSLFSSILRARMNAPSWPVSPTALPPCWLMRPTISWLSSPSTISTTFITRSSVTRIPCRNSLWMPILDSRSPICGPPPWTMTGFMPTSFSMTTSRAKPAFSVRFGHRVAAVLDDDRPVVKAADVRQRLGQYLRLDGGVDSIDRHGGRWRNRVRARVRGNCTRTPMSACSAPLRTSER